MVIHDAVGKLAEVFNTIQEEEGGPKLPQLY